MINPSVHGWIDKFFIEQKVAKLDAFDNNDSFYSEIRKTGFIYGHIIAFANKNGKIPDGWLDDEISKVALLSALFGVYNLNSSDNNTELFIEKTVAFYNEMNPQGFNFFKKVNKSNLGNYKVCHNSFKRQWINDHNQNDKLDYIETDYIDNDQRVIKFM